MTVLASDEEARLGVGRRTGFALATIAALSLGLLASIRRVDGREGYCVRDGVWLRSAPVVLAPGRHLVVPGFHRLFRYPSGSFDADFQKDGVPWISREGARLEYRARVRCRVEDDRVLDVHRAAAGGALDASIVEPALRGALASIAKDPTGPPAGSDAFRNQLRERLDAALAAGGLALERLDDAAQLSGGAGSVAKASVAGRNLLVVGLDGADWDIADPLIARGEMPHLARLVRDGTRARLRSIVPMLSPVIWTSIATGMGPAKHGIVDFLARSAKGDLVPVTSTLRRTPALWNILSDGGVRVSVTAWWATWPAEPVDGFMVTDRVAYQLFKEVIASDASGSAAESHGKSWPEALFGEIRPKIVLPGAVSDADLAPFVDLHALGAQNADDRERLQSLKTVIASTRTYEAIGIDLIRRRRSGFHAIYNESTDTIAHLFMAFHPPAPSGTDPRRAAAFARAVDAAYREADAMLGRILDAAGPGWNVIVLSDHGFRHGDNRPTTDPRVGHGPAADWHDRFGILVLSGPDVRRRTTVADASVLDVTPTILALYGLPVSEDMDGKVLEDALEPSFLLAHPVRRIPTYQHGVRQIVEVEPSSQDADLVEKLRSLGYVGRAPANEAAPTAGASPGFRQDSPSSIVNEGIVKLTEHDIDGAIVEFERARAVGGGVQAFVNLAYAHLLKSQLQEAENDIAEIERAQPRSGVLPGLRGMLADLRGDAAGAERHLREAIRVNPSDARARTRLGYVLERQGRKDDALAQYREAMRVDPNSAEALNYAGNIERERGRKSEAESLYRRAVDADPRYPGAYNNLGLLLQEQGRLDEADALYGKGLGFAPKSPLLHNSLGTVLLLKRDLVGAEREVRRALELQPGMTEALNNLGILAAERGQTDEARKRFEEAIAADPSSIDAHFNLGKVLLLLRRPEQSLDEFQRTLALAPRHRDAAIGAGEVAFKLGRRDVSLRSFERAREIDPNSPRILSRLGELYLDRGDRARAVEAWRKSLSLDPSQPSLREKLAAIEPK